MLLVCSHEGCSSIRRGKKDYCRRHWEQVLKYGRVLSNTKSEFNEVVDKGKYYELVVYNRNYKETGRIKIDKEDLEKVKCIGRWGLNSEGYARNFNNKTKKVVWMHRLIMDAEEDQEIDHVKVGLQYRSDNRKKNLRIATNSQNKFNTKKRKNNTSGYKGVTWSKKQNKWQAQIRVKDKNLYLGSFVSAIDAFEAYKKASKLYHKEFANF